MNDTNGRLVLKRKQGQWTNITDRVTGRTIRVRTCKIKNGFVDLVFEDPDFNFSIERPERKCLNSK